MKLNLPPKLVEKLRLGPSYLFRFVKNFIPSYALMLCYAETGCSRPLINCLAVWITVTCPSHTVQKMYQFLT
jgi:hypothetical protein